jgi:hypothetical protein
MNDMEAYESTRGHCIQLKKNGEFSEKNGEKQSLHQEGDKNYYSILKKNINSTRLINM